ncbi:helix-turn-helix protein [Scopulibacillus darangshiensis]|uniref:Helix-turn-helix protein n=1 Tax=Scopulibacillus darangshiensis TaxID=442528 RepID=A0A4R2P7S4_9BACL|nr:helix-turn-helix domain-containing protein [Scopulibacillus darangshiensis]TCP30953.1 helix-turn-helix protein [Scopulibacillus darangshiensis]
MKYYTFKLPPYLYYDDSNEDVFRMGDKHISRSNFEWFDLIIVEKGTLYLGEEGVNYTIGSNQGLILAPYAHHYSFKPCTEDTHFYWIHFQTTGQWTIKDSIEKKHANDSLYLPNFFSLKHTDPVFQILKELNSFLQINHLDNRFNQQIIFLQLIQRLIQNNTQAVSAKVIQIAESSATWLNNNFQRNISMVELGNVMNFHPSYISRCMKQVYGISMKKYLLKLRINHAKNLLSSKNDSIEKVAFKCGFNSLSFFSKTFTKGIGLSPSEFRNNYR